jgi:hypothetical protein
MADDDRTARILSYSPIGEARAITGEKDTPATDILSLFNIHAHAAETEKAMVARDDTWGHCTPEYFLRIVEEEGFVLLDEGLKAAREWPPDGERESWWMFWHPEDGIFMKADSYGTINFETKEPRMQLNGARLAFNLLFRRHGVDLRGCPGSTSPVEIDGNFYSCMHDNDGRDGLRFRLKKLRLAGAFHKPWVFGSHHIIFMSSAEWDQMTEKHGINWSMGSDPEIEAEVLGLCRARFERFPKEVQECVEICFAEDRYRRYQPKPGWDDT